MENNASKKEAKDSKDEKTIDMTDSKDEKTIDLTDETEEDQHDEDKKQFWRSLMDAVRSVTDIRHKPEGDPWPNFYNGVAQSNQGVEEDEKKESYIQQETHRASKTAKWRRRHPAREETRRRMPGSSNVWYRFVIGTGIAPIRVNPICMIWLRK